MPILRILRGIPGSGKSTYTDSLLTPGSTWKRINKDSLREMLDNSDWTPHNEYMLNRAAQSMARLYLLNGFDVVYDNMNLDGKVLRSFLRSLENHEPEIKIEYVDFTTPLEVCIERDSKRPKPIGAEVITKIHTRWMS